MQYSSQTGWWSVAIGKSIEWLCMEDCHSVKLSRLLALTVLVLNGSLFRNLTLVCYWASRSVLFFSSALSGSSWAGAPTHPVTVMFYKGGRGNSAHTSVFLNGKLLYSDSEEYFHQSIAGS